MEKLHLSSTYINHDLSPSPAQTSDCEMNVLRETAHCSITPTELESRLKTAQRITICEEVRKLTKIDEIIPKILLDKIESPCKSLVLWRPRNESEGIGKLLSVFENAEPERKSAVKRIEDLMDLDA